MYVRSSDIGTRVHYVNASYHSGSARDAALCTRRGSVCLWLSVRSNENADEANLLYVAVTRAKKRLVLTPALIQLLDLSGVRAHACAHTAA